MTKKCEVTVWVSVFATADGPQVSVSTFQPTVYPSDSGKSRHFGPYIVEFMPREVADLLNKMVIEGEVGSVPRIGGEARAK